MRLCFIELMNDIHRVLKHGGLFLHRKPAFSVKQVFQGPAHANINTEDVFANYFASLVSGLRVWVASLKAGLSLWIRNGKAQLG